jgi:hypothetical protein
LLEGTTFSGSLASLVQNRTTKTFPYLHGFRDAVLDIFRFWEISETGIADSNHAGAWPTEWHFLASGRVSGRSPGAGASEMPGRASSVVWGPIYAVCV